MQHPTNAEWADLYERAQVAGEHAAGAVQPQPMVVQEHKHVLDDTSPVVKSYYVADGVCGFAWVSIRPGTSRFARWLKRQEKGRTDTYSGGVTIWIGAYNQSYERKLAHARAMADVLNQAEAGDGGFTARAAGRLD